MGPIRRNNIGEMRAATLWESIGSLDWHGAVPIIIGCAAPFFVAWYLGAGLWGWLGAPDGREGTWNWFGFIPYPSPFTWREGLGVAIMLGLPLGFFVLWRLARRSYRTNHAGAG